MIPPNLKEAGQKALPYIAIAVIFLFGGAAIGWALKPDVLKIEEKIKTVDVIKEVVVVKEVVRVEVVKVKDTQVVERWHREKKTTTTPDGAVTTTETEDKNIDSIVKEKENSTQVKVVEVEKQVVVEKIVQVEVSKTPVLKDWHVGVTGGTELLAPVPVFGVEAERRIAGPFFLGAYGNFNTQFTRGQVGLKVAIEF